MDKRTLEMAAKAAGYEYEVRDDAVYVLVCPSVWSPWSPHLRPNQTWDLAKAIGAIVDFELGQITVSKYEDDLLEVEYATDHNDSIQEALVALAARIGESMQ